MDYKKIGKFIAAERKTKKMTQAKLAEKLFVSEKTVSKWENGKGIPDTNILQSLCDIFGISINELLNGERIADENYSEKAESKLLELQATKDHRDKMLLTLEIVVAVFSVIILFSFIVIANFLIVQTWLRVLLLICGVLIVLIGAGFALKIEQIAGYYICKKCNHKYIPSYKQVFFAMHSGRARYMKCPHCKQRSWNKKVIK